MNDIEHQLEQTPSPGEHMVRYRGDLSTFTLRVPGDLKGEAFLRTNLGRARIRYDEIVAKVEQGAAILARDWHDVRMTEDEPGVYTATMPMSQTGRFEAKAFWLPGPGAKPLWPVGDNTVIKVEPADYACGNAIYSAFVRQFGPHRSRVQTPSDFHESIRTLEQAGYAVIPVSGTFRDFAGQLDFILGELGFRIVQLLPVHPIPTTYARMGRFGSPFAALDYMDVDHALAEFDRKTTPLEQFVELVDAIHARAGRVFMDIPVNHTGWASRLQIEHPEWFVRDRNRMFKSPGAWGVTWEDLSELDYGQTDLWSYMADVFLFWARRGVDGFRCDAGYKVPYAVWDYIVAKVRREFPDTLFFLEGLGGKISTMNALLGGANLDWAYSELFQDEDRARIEHQLPGYMATSRERGTLIHFAETHDNNRLAARSPEYARMRVALAALASHAGGYGIANGVEWLATEKIDVHGAPSLRWGASDNLTALIRRLNAILRVHPCFGADAHVRMAQSEGENALALVREAGDRALLVLVNLCADRSQTVAWRRSDYGVNDRPHRDLISSADVDLEWTADDGRRRLNPGEVVCLTAEDGDVAMIDRVATGSGPLPVPSLEQAMRAQWFDMRGCEALTPDECRTAPETLRALAADPCAFGDERSSPKDATRPSPGAVSWSYPHDLKRTVMLPPNQALCVTAPHKFRATLTDGQVALCRLQGLPSEAGSYFALFPALAVPSASMRLQLDLVVYDPQGTRHGSGSLLLLGDGSRACSKKAFSRSEIEAADAYAMLSNERGAMVQARGEWGRIASQYDALLAGNMHREFPTDRQIMFTRCRAWLIYRGHWQDLDGDCVERFWTAGARQAVWRFRAPVSGGKTVALEARVRLSGDRNATRIAFRRLKGGTGDGRPLADSDLVELVLRPDIEDRGHHGKTKAYAGPETGWPQAVHGEAAGFVFRPDAERRLSLRISKGEFRCEPEWTYMVPHPIEADRGLDGASDLFSPGYFSVTLKGGEQADLEAEIVVGHAPPPSAAEFEDDAAHAGEPDSVPLTEALRDALKAFVVRRGAGKTVIAGYPWFLDWGRDTLIVLRGMIAAGQRQEAREIMIEFARFEDQGTLPNMIRGDDVSNRDTSDAPLWLFTACADLLASEGDDAFLAEDCGGRTVREALLSIGRHYRTGTPNGIGMDVDSGLIFSPSHFTWMDTNHPAGTPREGYPIEIQALWHAALRMLARLEPDADWAALAEQVGHSVAALFPVETAGERGRERYLSDCLHAAPGRSAAQAEADDALRPNQLLAITLGMVQDRSLGAAIVRACQALLVPGAIRSLADRPVRMPLPIRGRDGLLNDPERPYWGVYRGDEDTRRKPAYHNGTAWTWLYPSYAEALPMVFGPSALPTALAYAAVGETLINRGCIGQIPEIADGDTPHAQRGCGAQAWGVSELYRALDKFAKPA